MPTVLSSSAPLDALRIAHATELIVVTVVSDTHAYLIAILRAQYGSGHP